MAIKPYRYLLCKSCKHPRIDHGKSHNDKKCHLCECKKYKIDIFYHLDSFNLIFFSFYGVGIITGSLAILNANYARAAEFYAFFISLGIIFSIFYVRDKIKDDLKQRAREQKN